MTSDAIEHELKVWPPYFDALADGSKPFEVRKNDRGFKVGDTLRLREWSHVTGYTGREVTRLITYVLESDIWWPPHTAVLGLAALHSSPVGAQLEPFGVSDALHDQRREIEMYHTLVAEIRRLLGDDGLHAQLLDLPALIAARIRKEDR